jgi:hypothetical protein
MSRGLCWTGTYRRIVSPRWHAPFPAGVADGALQEGRPGRPQPGRATGPVSSRREARPVDALPTGGPRTPAARISPNSGARAGRAAGIECTHMPLAVHSPRHPCAAAYRLLPRAGLTRVKEASRPSGAASATVRNASCCTSRTAAPARAAGGARSGDPPDVRAGGDPGQPACGRRRVASRASAVIRCQSPALIASFGVSQDPPTQPTFGSAR